MSSMFAATAAIVQGLPKQPLPPSFRRSANAQNAHAQLQRKSSCACGGSCPSCKTKNTLDEKTLQKKLTIGASNDPLEQEADRVADQVLAAPISTQVNQSTPRIQRLSTNTVEASNTSNNTAPASVDSVLASSGRPLEPSIKNDMSQRFGHDFNRVRLHSGVAAEQSARDVNANAYTVGNNIIFGAGQYAPRTNQGKRLLAHELTHVVQQSASMESPLQRDAINNAPPDLSNEKVKPADKVVANQPQNEPELAKVIPYWDKDKKIWMYSDIQYREIKGTAVIGDISPRDIRQGTIGDCYLMAALISLAATNPIAIQNAITADGPGKWKVRLYAKQPDGSFKAVIYSIDNMFPTSSPGGMAYGHSNQLGTKQKSMGWTYVDNQYNDPLINPWDIPAEAVKKENFVELLDEDNRELWPAIIEKAYALHASVIGMKQQGVRAGGYDDIGQGDGSHNAFEALTGKPATETHMNNLGGDKLFQRIDAALRAGAPVAAGTPGNEKKRNEKFITGSNIYGNHAYAVIGLKGLEIELRNPWGNTYKSTDIEEHPELKTKDDSGVIKLTLDEFRTQFDAIYIGAATVPVK